MAISALGTTGIPPSSQSEAQYILKVLWNYYSNKFLKLIFTSCLLSCGRDNLCSRKVMPESAASSANHCACVELSLQKELEKLHFCSLWCFAYSFPPAFFRKGGINPHQNPTSLIPSCSCTLAKPFLKSAACFYSSWSQCWGLQSSCVCRVPGQGTGDISSVGAFHPAGSLFHGKSPSFLPTRDEVTRLISKATVTCLTSCSHFCFYYWISRPHSALQHLDCCDWVLFLNI